jgi:chitinase
VKSRRIEAAVVAAIAGAARFSVRALPAALLVAALACDTDTPQPVEPSLQPGAPNAALTATAPTVTITKPGNGATFAQGAKVTFAGTATNGSGGSLHGTSLVWSSSINTQTITGDSISTSLLPLGTHTFTLTARNSLGLTGKASVTITIGTVAANKAPTATITAPAAGASVKQGTSVTFTGAGTDAEDGALSGAALVWTSSINGQLGTGATFSTTALSAGTHTITLTAKDSKGATGTATRTVTVTATTPPPPPPSGGRWVTGYYVGYQRALYPETSVDFSSLTHVVMGTVIPQATGGIDTTFYVDNTNGPRMARNLSARAHQYGRKALLMLAGAGYHDALAGAASSANRARFVTNLLGAMDRLGYDGIDVDWEPVNAADMPSALALVQALRQARPGMLLTFPVYWVGMSATVDPWYAQLAAQVDQLNLMSYEMAGNWGGWVSWHSSALAGEGSDHPSSISSSAARYRAAGVPAAKLGAGLGTYGQCWQGVNDMRKPLSASAGVVAGDNVMTYATIMSSYYNATYYKWDATASMGYLAFPAATGPRGCTMVSYENPQSAAAKGTWVKSNGLGGAIVWTINQGHVSTAAAGQQDPITQALYNAMQ